MSFRTLRSFFQHWRYYKSFKSWSNTIIKRIIEERRLQMKSDVLEEWNELTETLKHRKVNAFVTQSKTLIP